MCGWLLCWLFTLCNCFRVGFKRVFSFFQCCQMGWGESWPLFVGVWSSLLVEQFNLPLSSLGMNHLIYACDCHVTLM